MNKENIRQTGSQFPTNQVSPKQSHHYQLVAAAIRFLNQNWSRQPDLAKLASHLNCSEYHLQRVFKQWAGISPKRFIQFLSKEYLAERLRQQTDIYLASLEAGLSGGGRAHDLMVTCEALSPGEIKSGAKALTSIVDWLTHLLARFCWVGTRAAFAT